MFQNFKSNIDYASPFSVNGKILFYHNKAFETHTLVQHASKQIQVLTVPDF